MSGRNAWIVDGLRTPFGRHRGALSAIRADDLAALQACDRTLALQPAHVPAWCNCGELLLRRGEPALALRAYEQALALAPTHLAALIGRATVLTAQARPRDALVSAEQAVRLAPEDYEALRCLGTALWKLRRFVEAAGYLEKANRRIVPCWAR